MKKLCLAFIVLVFSTSLVQADNGLVKKLSARGVQTTMDSLENLIRNKGLTVFARIDHAVGAAGPSSTVQ